MKSFNEITVRQFQDLYKVQKSDLDELDKLTESVAVLTGKSNREVEEMPLPEFNQVANSIANVLSQTELKAEPKRVLEINGKLYGICYEPSKLRSGQYIEVQHFMKGDIFENMHLIMASISYPVKKKWYGLVAGKNDSTKHEQVSWDFQDARLVDVYSSCVFFCQLLKTSIKGLEEWLKKEITRNKMSPTLVTDLMKTMDGSMQQSKWPTLRT